MSRPIPRSRRLPLRPFLLAALSTLPLLTGLTCLTCLTGLTGCKSGANAATIERKRDWVEFGLLADARLDKDQDGIQSGPGGYFAAGHNLGPGDARLLAGLEGQVNFSWNQVDVPPGTSDRTTLMRGAFGGRLAWSLPSLRVTPVVRGGAYYRWGFGGTGSGPAPVNPEGGGWYAGLGLEFVPYTDSLAHVFVTTYAPSDMGEPDEVIIGIGVTSHY